MKAECDEVHSQGVTKAALERFENDFGMMCADFFDLDVARTKKLCH